MDVQLNNINSVILYGAGGHCKVVIDILEALGINVGAIVDDNPTATNLLNYSLLKANVSYNNAIITIGNCHIRKMIAQRIKVNNYITAIHPSAVISPHSEIGDGTVVMQGAIIQSCARIGNHVIINTNSSIDHECRIADFVHIAPGATLSGNVEVGECSWIGVGACVKQGIRIGKNCMIGAGSVVVKDIPDNVVVYGNPCKVVRPNL